jgi:hypothetical protein
MAGMPSDLKSDQESAWWIRALRTSITTRNNIGDNGSPWWRPRAWQILLSDVPLRNTLVLADDSKAKIQLRQREENPRCYNNSIRNDQVKKLKERAMSTLSSTLFFFQACNNFFAVRWTILKLSCMTLPLMNTLWLAWTNSQRRGASLLARTLDTSLPIVTEPPQKWGVCLPRSYQGILDEARMRKHTQISIRYQIWNSS